MIPEQESVYIDGDTTQFDETKLEILDESIQILDESLLAAMDRSQYEAFLRESKQFIG